MFLFDFDWAGLRYPPNLNNKRHNEVKDDELIYLEGTWLGICLCNEAFMKRLIIIFLLPRNTPCLASAILPLSHATDIQRPIHK